jgi:hypothetical protein
LCPVFAISYGLFQYHLCKNNSSDISLSNWLFYYDNRYILSTILPFMVTPRLEDCVTYSGCVTSGFDSRIMQKVIQFLVIFCLFVPFLNLLRHIFNVSCSEFSSCLSLETTTLCCLLCRFLPILYLQIFPSSLLVYC